MFFCVWFFFLLLKFKHPKARNHTGVFAWWLSVNQFMLPQWLISGLKKWPHPSISCIQEETERGRSVIKGITGPALKIWVGQILLAVDEEECLVGCWARVPYFSPHPVLLAVCPSILIALTQPRCWYRWPGTFYSSFGTLMTGVSIFANILKERQLPPLICISQHAYSCITQNAQDSSVCLSMIFQSKSE